MEVNQDTVRTDIPTPKKSFYSQYVKRFLDIVLSAAAILVLSPLLLVLTLLQWIYQGTPILYIDTRPGLNGKPFGLMKFRSMSFEKDKDGKLLHPSQRITPYGRFLRRYSLDELPELLNILKGDMSIIGPRPLMMTYLPLYNQRHAYRHAVRPGLACWNLSQGDTVTAKTFTWNTQFEGDIYYVENVSFMLDVKMVIKTIKIMLKKSEMRTNADRVRFDGKNLLETRSRHELIADRERAESDKA